MLETYHVEYVETGANVKKGNVNIACPFCGDDPSHHLGIDPVSGFWGCWRNKAHRGRKFSNLLAKLAHISFSEAQKLCGEKGSVPLEENDFDNAVAALKSNTEQVQVVTGVNSLQLPSFFRELDQTSLACAQHVQYLNLRGYKNKKLTRLIEQFDLRFSLRGDFTKRIIIPVYENGLLQTYLGRSVYKNHALRYRALEVEKSVTPVEQCLYNVDTAFKYKSRKILFVVEGATDVWRMQSIARCYKCSVVGLFNMNIADRQAEHLDTLQAHYEKIIFILDRGELARYVSIRSQVPFIRNLEVYPLTQAEDPGALTSNQVHALIKKACS
ncbi:hypothetical protein KAR91_28625 [Candidatus Pacearchaeota archaeon]|nr:hypothetical protein [Candidatus Pacearchaeota archaeon]